MTERACYWIYIGDELRYICDTLQIGVECLLQSEDFLSDTIWSPITNTEVTVIEEFGEDWQQYFLEHPLTLEEYYDIHFDRGYRYE